MGTTAVNLVIGLVLGGEPAWLCLMLCKFDGWSLLTCSSVVVLELFFFFLGRGGGKGLRWAVDSIQPARARINVHCS